MGERSRVSDHASAELAELRLSFKQAYPRIYASPENLGKHARDTNAKILDYGQHSNSWISLFERSNCGDNPIRRYAATFLVPSPLDLP